MTLRMGEKVTKISIDAGTPMRRARRTTSMAEAQLESGKTLRADTLLYCIGRQGCDGRVEPCERRARS